MKPAAFAYRAPASVAEALALLAANPDAKLLAGGQSLVPVMNFRLATPPMLVDLNRIAALAGLAETPAGDLIAGAMTRHRVFERDPRVKARVPLAAEAARHIAHGPIRNRGTIGGSLCHADPAAEWPAVALATGAGMNIAGPGGATRTVAAESFVQGTFATDLRPGEILTAVTFPAAPPGRRHGFVEMARRTGDFAIVGVALTLDPDSRGRIAAARIAVFGAHDCALRVADAEALLLGAPLDAMLEPVRAAAATARAKVPTRGDHHASMEYRSQLVEVLVRRALEHALAV